jgi:hypothetical protein
VNPQAFPLAADEHARKRVELLKQGSPAKVHPTLRGFLPLAALTGCQHNLVLLSTKDASNLFVLDPMGLTHPRAHWLR